MTSVFCFLVSGSGRQRMFALKLAMKVAKPERTTSATLVEVNAQSALTST